MKVEEIWCLFRSFEDSERLGVQMGAGFVAAILGERETQVRNVRFEQGQPAKVVCVVAWDDGQPCIEQVVAFLDKDAVVSCERLESFGGPIPKRFPVGTIKQ